MNGKALTFGGIIAAATPALMWAYQAGVITAPGIRYALMVASLALLSLVISWGMTEAYKRLLVIEPWGSPAGRRKIYACALLTGSSAMMLCGAVFLVLVEFTWKLATAIGVMWLLGSIAVGVSSPWFWRVTFERVLPMVAQCLNGRGPAP